MRVWTEKGSNTTGVAMSLGTSFAAPSKDAGCRTWPRSPQSHWESPQQPSVLCLLWENGSGLAPHWGSGQSLQKLELECGPSGTPLSVPEGDGERWRDGRLDAVTVGGRPAQWKAICPSAHLPGPCGTFLQGVSPAL